MRTIQEFCVFCCHKCHTILYNQLCNKWLRTSNKQILTNRERQRMFSFFFRLKNQGKERINEGKMNAQTDFVWHLWQQKTQTAVGCAPTRARERLAKKEQTMSNERRRKSKFPQKEGIRWQGRWSKKEIKGRRRGRKTKYEGNNSRTISDRFWRLIAHRQHICSTSKWNLYRN